MTGGSGGSPLSAAQRRALWELDLRSTVDRLTAEVVGILTANGIRPLLLKGPAHARWLYERGDSRPYVDSDLLIAPGDLDRAGRVLAEAGFTCVRDDRAWDSVVPEPHEQAWHRAGDRGFVELHWRLPGSGRDPESAWPFLATGTETIQVGGRSVEILGGAGRALHTAIHAAQHPDGKSLRELERALERADEATWRSAGELAGEIDATGSLSAGLRLTPAGSSLADRLGLAAARAPAWEALAAAAPPGTFPIQRIAAASGRRAKLASLLRSLAPPPDYVRAGSALARRGRPGLALAYAVRLGKAGRHLPKAWRVARRTGPQSGVMGR